MIATILDIDGTLIESFGFDSASYVSAIRDVLGEVYIDDDWSQKHWQCVNQILEKYTTQRGIETNEHRELLIVQKSA